MGLAISIYKGGVTSQVKYYIHKFQLKKELFLVWQPWFRPGTEPRFPLTWLSGAEWWIKLETTMRSPQPADDDQQFLSHINMVQNTNRIIHSSSTSKYQATTMKIHRGLIDVKVLFDTTISDATNSAHTRCCVCICKHLQSFTRKNKALCQDLWEYNFVTCNFGKTNEKPPITVFTWTERPGKNFPRWHDGSPDLPLSLF